MNRLRILPSPFNIGAEPRIRPSGYRPQNDEELNLMKKGGKMRKKKTKRVPIKPKPGINIKLNINVGRNEPREKPLRARTNVPSREMKQKGFREEDTPLRKPDFVRLLSRSQLPETKSIYTGNNMRLLQPSTIFGNVPPRPLGPSSYAIPTTINNPIKGTYQVEYKTPTPSENKGLDKSDIKKAIDDSLKEYYEQEELKKGLKPSNPPLVGFPGFGTEEEEVDEEEVEEEDVKKKKKKKTSQPSLSNKDYDNLYRLLRRKNEIDSVSNWQKLNVQEKQTFINNFSEDLENIYKVYKYPSEAGEIKKQKYKLKDEDIPEQVYKQWKETQGKEEEEEEEEDEDEE